MYLDSSLAFDPSGSAITTSRDSTNVLDMLNARDMGVGIYELKLLINIQQAFAGGTSLQVSFQGSPDNVNYETYVQSPPYLLANLTVGARLLEIMLPRPGLNLAPGRIPRYYKLNYAVVGPFTAGALFAGLVLDRSADVQYPKNFTVNN